jgi:hypothetical protein
LILLNQLLNAVDFVAAEAAALLQPHRVEPEFRLVTLSLDVNMGWLIPVAGVKKESVRSNSQNSRHTFTTFYCRWGILQSHCRRVSQRFPDVGLLQFRIFALQILAVRIQGRRFHHAAHRQTKIPDARLAIIRFGSQVMRLKVMAYS